MPVERVVAHAGAGATRAARAPEFCGWGCARGENSPFRDPSPRSPLPPRSHPFVGPGVTGKTLL